jgi:type VI secretion system protein ImpA
LRTKLDAYRKEPDPDFDGPNAPPADWDKVIAVTSDFLATKGKDLTAAARLTEALTKKHTTAGLRDGVTLLARLAEGCWDGLHPPLGPAPLSESPTHAELLERFEARSNRLNWLNRAGEGGKLPLSVLRMPVLKTTRGGFSAAEWLSPAGRADVETHLPDITPDAVKQAAAELAEVRDALAALGKALDDRMWSESPNLTEDAKDGLGAAVMQCLEFVYWVATKKGVNVDDAPATDDTPPEDDRPPAGGGGTSGPAAVGGGRDQLYRQLAQIADALKRIEPHSPIPFLLDRCVRLGAMPFPELMREVIREQGTLDELDRLLGLSGGGGGG